MGVRCAIGHTHAEPEQIVRAADAGAELATHLGNAAHAVRPATRTTCGPSSPTTACTPVSSRTATTCRPTPSR